MIEQISPGLQKLRRPVRSGCPKSLGFQAVLQATRVNLVSSTRRVSSELDILQFSVVDHLHNHIYQSLRSGRIWHKVNF